MAVVDREGVSELIENIVVIKRVSKVTKGGKNFKLSVWVVVGDGQGRVAVSYTHLTLPTN